MKLQFEDWRICAHSLKMEETLSSVQVQRSGHVAVTWNDCIIIWGGRDLELSCCDINEVMIHYDGTWRYKKTIGNVDVPRGFSYNLTAQVVGDKMYVFGGQPFGNVHAGAHGKDPLQNQMSVLDLKSWNWSKFKPVGSSPIRCINQTSWVHNNKIYVFGGGWTSSTYFGINTDVNYPIGVQVVDGSSYAVTNQLFCYDTANNCFEWPSIKDEGNILTPRWGHSSFIQGKTAFIFGGNHNNLISAINHNVNRRNDLIILDLETMILRQVHGSSNAWGLPSKRAWHSMTKISSVKAVLYGGYYERNDCWILDVKKALQGKFVEASSLWTECRATDSKEELPVRESHSAVIEPKSKRLYILGGYSGSSGTSYDIDMSDKALVITFTPTSLELLAMEHVIKVYGPESPLLEEFLPKDHEMRKTLEGRRHTSRKEKMLQISW